MNTKLVSTLAIVLALAAVLLAIGAFVSGGQTQSLAHEGSTADAARVDALERQLAKLEADVARDAQREPLEAPAQATRESAQPPQPSAAIEARIAALEKAIAQLQSDLRAAREPRPAAAPASTDDIRSAQRVTNDFGATDQERVQALGKLRGSQIDGKPAITEDVLRSMVDLAERSPDESVRHDVYRNLHNSPSPLVRDSMLRALAGDPSAKVRKRAAQDIDTYLAEAIVVTALQNAAANDADESVRAQAKKTLAKDR